MSMLLASNQIWNYVLIGIVALLLIAMPIMMNARNKRETQKVQEQTNSLRVGDKVLTTSGVYGTITEIKFDDSKKQVVIETGGKNKSYLTIDAYAIYTVFKSDAELAREAEEKEKLKEESKEKSDDKKKNNGVIESELSEVTEAKSKKRTKKEDK